MFLLCFGNNPKIIIVLIIAPILFCININLFGGLNQDEAMELSLKLRLQIKAINNKLEVVNAI